MRNFKDLKIWHRSIELVDQIYDLVIDLPTDERFGLNTQIKRSVVSIPSNIAEGCSRKTEKELSRFLEIAIGSSFELETQLIITSRRHLLNEGKINSVLNELNQIQKMLSSFYKNVRAKI